MIDGIGIELPGPLGALADEHPALTPALPAPVRSAKSRVDELLHGDVGRRVTLARALVAPSPAFMRWNYGAPATPRLYGRRWKELYRRAHDARIDDPSDAIRPRRRAPLAATRWDCPPRPGASSSAATRRPRVASPRRARRSPSARR